MIISVQRGLSALKERLSQKGYTVVFSDEYSRPVDIYVYNGRSAGFSSFFQPPEISSSSVMNIDNIVHYGGNCRGIVEINAYGKSLEEIEGLIIRSRHNIYY